MSSFRDLLSKRTEEVTPPKALPAGTYTFMIERFEIGESKKKKTPQVEFQCKPVSYEADVDEAELSDQDWQKRTLRKTFYITDQALYRLSNFIKTVLGGEAEGRQLEECLPVLVNRSFKGEVTQRPGDDGSIYNDIGSTAADDE